MTAAVLASVLRAHTGAASAPLVRGALPVAAAFGAVGAVFFGPMGVTAADVVEAADTGTLPRLAAWLVWLLPTAPLAAVALDPPGAHWLRSLPVARGALWAVSAAALLAVEIPFGLFVARGGGPALAASWIFVAAAAHAQAFLGMRSAADLLLGAAIAAFALVPSVTWLAMPVALLVSWRAWRHAAERGRSLGRARIAGPPSVALTHAHLLGVVRGDAASLARAALLLALAGALAGLVGDNDALASSGAWARVSFGIGGPALALALSGPVAAVLRHEHGARPLLDALGLPGRTRVAAAASASAIVGLGGGAVYAVALVASAHMSPFFAPAGTAPWALVAATAAGGPIVAALLAGTHRHALARASRVAHRLLAAVLAVGVVVGAAGASLGLWALLPWAGLALIVLAATAPEAPRPQDPEDAWGREGA